MTTVTPDNVDAIPAAWSGFTPGAWQDGIDVRDFIQRNYTPYTGDSALNDIRPGVVTRVEVLPFHQMGADKWEALGLRYELAGVAAPEAELVDRVRGQFRAHGLTTY